MSKTLIELSEAADRLGRLTAGMLVPDPEAALDRVWDAATGKPGWNGGPQPFGPGHVVDALALVDALDTPPTDADDPQEDDRVCSRSALALIATFRDAYLAATPLRQKSVAVTESAALRGAARHLVAV
jgi:hypothetical protein